MGEPGVEYDEERVILANDTHFTLVPTQLEELRKAPATLFNECMRAGQDMTCLQRLSPGLALRLCQDLARK